MILHHLSTKGKFKDKSGATGRRIALAALYHANNQCGGGQGVKRFCEAFSDMVTLQSFNKAKKVKRGQLAGFTVGTGKLYRVYVGAPCLMVFGRLVFCGGCARAF